MVFDTALLPARVRRLFHPRRGCRGAASAAGPDAERRYEVTGILDPDEAVGSSGPTGLQLILCQGDRCEQQSFQVTAQGEGYDVCLLASDPDPRSGSSLLPELDPPPGPRRGWLDRELPKHAFTVLLFYRGFW